MTVSNQLFWTEPPNQKRLSLLITIYHRPKKDARGCGKIDEIDKRLDKSVLLDSKCEIMKENIEKERKMKKTKKLVSVLITLTMILP